MGRSFESVRMGVKDVSARWQKASRALKKEDQVYGQKQAEMARKHSSEAFYALDDPREASGIFSTGGAAKRAGEGLGRGGICAQVGLFVAFWLAEQADRL